MTFNQETLNHVYDRTDGHCHICRKKLVRKNYGVLGSRGAWEAEHSKPRAQGGSNHGNNLYAACISCNRSKGKSSTRSARSKNGFKAAPYSQEKKTKNAWLGAGTVCGAAWLLAPPQFKIPMAILGALLGGHAGKNAKPD